MFHESSNGIRVRRLFGAARHVLTLESPPFRGVGKGCYGGA